MGGFMKKIKPMPRKPITKLKKPYEGSDVFMEWHKERMKSTPQDADYATAIWRCESEHEYGWRVLKGWVGIISGVGFAYWFAIGVIDWLKNGG
jgi:hypothetical protein